MRSKDATAAIANIRNSEQLARREPLQHSARLGTAENWLLVLNGTAQDKWGGPTEQEEQAACMGHPTQNWRLVWVSHAGGRNTVQAPAPQASHHAARSLVSLTKHAHPWLLDMNHCEQPWCTFSGCWLPQLQSAPSTGGTEVSIQAHQKWMCI